MYEYEIKIHRFNILDLPINQTKHGHLAIFPRRCTENLTLEAIKIKWINKKVKKKSDQSASLTLLLQMKKKKNTYNMLYTLNKDKVSLP